MTIAINLPRTINRSLASEIEKESAFVSPYLTELKISDDLNAALIDLSDPGQEAEVREKLERFLGHMVRELPTFDTKTFFRTERQDTGDYETEVHQQLVERGWIHDYGRGRASLDGPARALQRYIDRLAYKLYHRAFPMAEDRDFPALIDAELLWKCGYFDSHPNTACFVGHVVEDFDSIESFRAENASSDKFPDAAARTCPHARHVPESGSMFPCLSDVERAGDGRTGADHDLEGSGFPLQIRNVSGLDRLWEFNVREIVFAGSDEFTADCRRRVLPLIEEIAIRLDLDCAVETARRSVLRHCFCRQDILAARSGS